MKQIGVFDKVEFVRQKMGLITGEINGVCSSYDDLKRLVRTPTQMRRKTSTVISARPTG